MIEEDHRVWGSGRTLLCTPAMVIFSLSLSLSLSCFAKSSEAGSCFLYYTKQQVILIMRTDN
jgi:fumarate reductase subunit C